MWGEKYHNLSQAHCDTHLSGPVMRRKVIKGKKRKRKAQELRYTVYPNLLVAIHILRETQSKLEALELGTFPYLTY